MALLRLTRRLDVLEANRDDEVIINTAHVVMVYSDSNKPSRGVWVQLVNGDPVLIQMSFDEIWQLIQRET